MINKRYPKKKTVFFSAYGKAHRHKTQEQTWYHAHMEDRQRSTHTHTHSWFTPMVSLRIWRNLRTFEANKFSSDSFLLCISLFFGRAPSRGHAHVSGSAWSVVTRRSSWVALRPRSHSKVSQEDKKKRRPEKAARRHPAGTKETIKHPTRAQYNGDSKIGSELQNDGGLRGARSFCHGRASHTWKQPLLRPRDSRCHVVPQSNQQTTKYTNSIILHATQYDTVSQAIYYTSQKYEIFRKTQNLTQRNGQ